MCIGTDEFEKRFTDMNSLNKHELFSSNQFEFNSDTISKIGLLI